MAEIKGKQNQIEINDNYNRKNIKYKIYYILYIMKKYTVPVKIDGKDVTMSIWADTTKINELAIFMQILKQLTDNKK